MCPEEELQKRLAHRAADEKESSDGRWEVFADQKKDFEKVAGLSPDLYLPLHTQGPIGGCLEAIFYHLRHRVGRDLSGQLNG